jgi:hypothetical protein
VLGRRRPRVDDRPLRDGVRVSANRAARPVAAAALGVDAERHAPSIASTVTAPRTAVWADQNHLITGAGKRINHAVIRDVLMQQRKIYRIEQIGFDPWHADQVVDSLASKGTTVDGFGEEQVVLVAQTYAGMSQAALDYEADGARGPVDANDCPLMRWAHSNAVVQKRRERQHLPDQEAEPRAHRPGDGHDHRLAPGHARSEDPGEEATRAADLDTERIRTRAGGRRTPVRNRSAAALGDRRSLLARAASAMAAIGRRRGCCCSSRSRARGVGCGRRWDGKRSSPGLSAVGRAAVAVRRFVIRPTRRQGGAKGD